MTHLTDEEVHLLLDGALGESQAVGLRRHLAGCVSCARRLGAAAELFAAIESWEDQPPSRDLSVAVLRMLRPPATSVGWRLATALQAAVALGAAVVGWPLIEQLAAAVDLAALLAPDPALVEDWPTYFAATAASLEPAARAGLEQVEAWIAGTAWALAWWPVLLAAAAAALVGNSLLLTRAGGASFSGPGRS